MFRSVGKRISSSPGVKSLFNGRWVSSGVLTRSMPQLSSKPITTIRFNSYINTAGENIESKIDHLTDQQYSQISNQYLETLADELEELSEQYPQIDSELNQGVLTVSLPPHGSYVINKQPPNKQIWLSSPVSGPKRYDLIGGRWVTLRDETSLTDLLQDEISSALETQFEFQAIEA
ncbi:Frataxin-like domain-containing protein [Scheffersomyces coipomensis]|uniref:Frataxin-like domain-containing protein n=1 Tax=Scheffersomyces coipomensis TaxID=1788519 RepID=UPI00315D15B7